MSKKSPKKRGLGRGLSALMAELDPETITPSDDVTRGLRNPQTTQERAGTKYIPIEQVTPNPDQPRKRFDENDLQDLANSIREKGIIQPLIVRAKSGAYEIVAGERRWRAAQMVQLHEVPALVR